MGAGDEETAAMRAYFHAIEETFIRLRGAPLLLSAADWQLAKRWYEAGVPLELVRGAMEEVFERRRARGAKGKVQGLRYCRHAIDEAWREVQELSNVETRRSAAPVDVSSRLGALARALPAQLPRRATWAARIEELRGTAEVVEHRLADLDRALVDERWEDLDEDARRSIVRQVDEALAAVAGRVGEEDLAVARERLRRQRLRRAEALPVLSLFSPEAESDEPEGGDS